MYSRKVLLPRNLKLVYPQGWFLLGALRENLFLVHLPASGDFQQFLSLLGMLACRHITPISNSVFSWLSFVYFHVLNLSFFSLIKTTAIGFRAHPKSRMTSSRDPLLKSSKTLFPNKVTFKEPGVRIWTYLFGGTQFSTLQLNFCFSQTQPFLLITDSNLTQINNSLFCSIILGSMSYQMVEFYPLSI